VAYFPHEIRVTGPDVEALRMGVRMAAHSPDLDMMGAHGFTQLMASPGAAKDALEALIGVKWVSAAESEAKCFSRGSATRGNMVY
jgi:hypothetical protein